MYFLICVCHPCAGAMPGSLSCLHDPAQHCCHHHWQHIVAYLSRLRSHRSRWHNTSYIGSSWGTIIGGLDVESYQLTVDQLNSCMLFQSHWKLGQLCSLLSIHCYSGALPRLAAHRHTMVRYWAIAAMPSKIQTLAHNGEEIDEVIEPGEPIPPRTAIEVVVPNTVDVNVRRG